MNKINLLLILFLTLVALPLLAYADSTVVRPTLDGSEDSNDWFKAGETPACNSTSCYTEVDESSGLECGGSSDGDNSYIYTESSEANQTFRVNKSKIPNGSRITDIEISVCYRGEVGDSEFTTRLCAGGDCLNGKEVSITNNSYTQVSQSFPVDIIKTGVTDLDIGVRSIAAGFLNTVNVSSISANVIYTPPACNDGIDNDGDGSIDYPEDSDCGSLSGRSEGPSSGEYRDGVLIPTVSLDKSYISPGESLKIYGYYDPNTTLEIVVDGFLSRTVESESDGYWEYDLEAEEVGPGFHSAVVREVDSPDNVLSSEINFEVASLRFPESDLNSDEVLNISDLSVFLLRWRAGDAAKSTLDMNGDGVVGIQDFSIFVHNLRF